MLVLAHRGYHAELPENTLAAFEAALNLGADGIETDVQVTRDGAPILFHDTTIQGRMVGDLTHAELCRLSELEVPTLVSALDAFPHTFWNLEIKMPTDPLKAWLVLKDYREKRRLLVSSFWHPTALWSGQEYGVECGLLIAHLPMTFTSLLMGLPRNLPRSRVAVVWEFNGVEEAMIEAARQEGVKTYVYGPQTLSDHELLASWKVDGIITDHPALALKSASRG